MKELSISTKMFIFPGQPRYTMTLDFIKKQLEAFAIKLAKFEWHILMKLIIKMSYNF